jgi:hypothetical protein
MRAENGEDYLNVTAIRLEAKALRLQINYPA